MSVCGKDQYLDRRSHRRLCLLDLQGTAIALGTMRCSRLAFMFVYLAMHFDSCFRVTSITVAGSDSRIAEIYSIKAKVGPKCTSISL